MIHCGDEDEARISNPVGEGDEIQSLIPFGYEWGNM